MQQLIAEMLNEDTKMLLETVVSSGLHYTSVASVAVYVRGSPR